MSRFAVRSETGGQLAAPKFSALQTLVDVTRDQRCGDLVDADVAEMIAPARYRLALAGNCVGTLPLHFCFLKIGGAIIAKERFTADCWQLIFAPLMSFDFECFTRS